MKILCLQLARFGDIYQTWPALNAIRRQYPEAEIHFLVRERFSAATVGLVSVNEILKLNTQEILAPLLQDRPLTDSSLKRLSTFVQALRDEQYDKIINLSFSPVSSYLVDLITHPTTIVAGYTRYSDGFLCIPDDPSAYFYAQVGIDKSNRIHLCDIFALIAGVELCDDDFQVEVPKNDNFELSQPYVVVHVGASQASKSCSAETWRQLTEEILKKYSGDIVFIGSQDEAEKVPKISDARIRDFAGKTQMSDLFGILKNAQALVGCDSVALQIANFTATPTLNISFMSVRFWETGPRAKGSRVFWFENEAKIEASKLAEELQRILNGQPALGMSIEKDEAFGVIYSLNGYSEDDFSWELTKALYMNHEFPRPNRHNIRLGFTRMGELARLGLEQISMIHDKAKREMAVGILNEIDALLIKVEEFVPDISPVVRWFQTEKLRVGPSSLEEVVASTKDVFQKLNGICQVYEITEVMNESISREGLSWKS